MADKKPVVIEGVGGTYEIYTPMGKRSKTAKKTAGKKPVKKSIKKK